MQKLLKDIGAFRRVRDPIYGYIWLTEEEMRIVDTPLFQRLRRVHQLALTKYVYPTAENSRFVHSLGVVHCATEMYSWIIRNAEVANIRLVHQHQITDYLIALRYAALLHDIGHLAFSHAAEDRLLTGITHEDISQHIITNYEPIAEVLDEKAPIVSGLLASQPKKKYEILHLIVSGQLDADRADYLLRDSYYCGVKYGEYDYKRYISSFCAEKSGPDIKLYIKHRDMPVIESFLLARYHYNLQVPFHRTRMGYDKVLCKYFESMKEYSQDVFLDVDKNNTITKMDFSFFFDFDDYSVFQKIKKDCPNNYWAHLLLREGHLKCVFDIATSQDDEKSKALLKKYISGLQDAGLKRNEDFFAVRKKVEISKYGDAPEVNGEGDPYRSQISVELADGSMRSIQECSAIIPKLVNPTQLLRVYAVEEYAEKAQNIYKALTS